MPTIADLRKHIKGYKADTVCAFDIWLVEDVEDRCALTADYTKAFARKEYLEIKLKRLDETPNV